MPENNVSESLRKSVLLYSIISGLVLAVVVAAVSMIPLYRTMRSQQENKLLSVLHARAAAVEIYLWETREIARQMASRTYLRDNFGNLTKDSTEYPIASAKIRKSLVDAVSTSPSIVSAYCLDKNGTPIMHVGNALPMSVLDIIRKGSDEQEGTYPLQIQGEYRLLHHIAIDNHEDQRQGVMVVAYDFKTLRNRINLLPDVGINEDTFVGYAKDQDVLIFLEMRGNEREHRRHGKPSKRLLEALRRSTDDQTGILEEDETLTESEIFAYRPVAGTDWGIAIRQSNRTLLADIDDQIFRIGGIVFLLIFIIGAGMFLMLLPLAGKMVLHSRELEKRIKDQTADLEEEQKRLLAITEQLNRQKKHLEAANEDLDAFSRTVAHDLCTPLVTIQGFSELLLLNDHIRQDAESVDMLNRVVAKAQLMAAQIKALLRYARAGKAKLNRKTVDLSQVAEDLAGDLRNAYSGIKVDFKVQAGMQVFADEPLLYNVMENLLGNAWKYSSKTKNPVVEVGSEDRNGETEYFIRDNGAGFDMMFAEKLFQPFQRLHSDEQFSGTGIGLSTVKRIIEQHGGKIRAEGKIGEGATFYFTIPGEPE